MMQSLVLPATMNNNVRTELRIHGTNNVIEFIFGSKYFALQNERRFRK